jgi:hypothetical protein
MTKDAVDVALKGEAIGRFADPSDATQEVWSFKDSTGINSVIFKSGRVISVDANLSPFEGEARDLARKLYSLLHLMTKATSDNERTASATISLTEYPSVTGADPIRRVELRIGDRRVDLLLMQEIVLVGQGLGRSASRR